MTSDSSFPLRFGPVSRRTFLGASGAAAATLLIGRSGQAFAAETPQKGGTLTMAIWPDPTALVCAFTTSDQVLLASSKMTEGLVAYGYDFKPQPRLATAWQLSPDGLTATFTLRQGVKWHDGKDFTSADVAFSFMQLLKPNHPRGRGTFANLTAVDTPDDHTAILRFSKPSPMAMNALSAFESPILPKHVYEQGDPLRNPANNAPIGTGPFKFVEWNRGSHITLERFDGYWAKEKPLLDRIVMRVINDASSRAAALETGEILLAGPNPVPYSELARFRSNAKFDVETRGEELLQHAQAIQVNLRNPALAKLEVRQAILQAVNRENLARAVWYQSGKPATSPIPYQAGDIRLANPPAYPFDPKKSEALLDAAGFPRGADKTRLKLRLDWVPLGEANLRAAEFIKQSLQRVGIEVSIRSSDLPTYLKAIYTDYDYDLNVFLYAPIFDPSMGLQRFYWSKAAKAGSPFVNASGYASPEMDKVLEAAGTEIDPDKRKALFHEFQKLAMTDLPILPLLDLDYTCIINKRVHDVMAMPEGIRGSFADVWLSA
ncbi:peptide ABC transporter substrate-binding protein [Azorhizobium oxalatiphilum]|uniref:Peptide ABC transporter substrate-binding protein n=1 Tax=Azorhizobium oxalatiphilum TaxID=980631 RepID=A0A917FHP5_9HYPH|nr:ABC transporter substrate-binding protein [Azorhizobium oxalatiphilum]GGF77272.1 peptide ABC transporter substrate-binding protein [Azorhizobium oxalatiphilum]